MKIGLFFLLVAFTFGLKNKQVDRFLDLTTPIVREQVAVLIDNPNLSTEYLISIPKSLDIHKSFLHVYLGKDASGQQLVVNKADYEKENNVQNYKVKIPAKESVDIFIRSGYTHVLENLPKSVAQITIHSIESEETKQNLLLKEWNAYFTTSFETELQTLNVRFPNSKIKSFTTIAASKKSQSSVTYGPYESIGPFSREAVQFHYSYPSPVLVAKELTRTLTLSHWNFRVGVHEEWELHNRGALLKGHFSRIDLMTTQRVDLEQNMARGIMLKLPPSSSDVYFKDYNGNVSTTRFRFSESQECELQFFPRFPLYGGWRYTWFHGYKNPLSASVEKTDKSFVFKTKIVSGIANLTYDQVTVEIQLPEGASNIKVVPPFKPHSQSLSKSYSYLDTFGKPTVSLVFKNIVDELGQDITISYEYPSYMLLYKPLVVIATFLILFILAMAYSRLDLSIRVNQVSKEKKNK